MDYPIQQLTIHCRICGRQVIDHRGKCMYIVYKCKELAESLQQALAINVNDDVLPGTLNAFANPAI